MGSEGEQNGQRGLFSLKKGEVAIVERLLDGRYSTKRLADMGFIKGARLEMIRPGAPCIVRVDGIRVGLGRAHQACIRVAPA